MIKYPEGVTSIDESKETIGDELDLFELGSRVHSKERRTQILNRDFTLADTSKELEDWAVKHLIISKMLVEDAIKVDERANKELRRDLIFAKKLKENEKLPEELQSDYAKQLEDCLLEELRARLIFTRSRGGKVINALLNSRKAEIEKAELEEKKQTGIISGILKKASKEDAGQ